MTILAVDIGNTSTTIGLFDGAGPLEHRFDIPTRTLTHQALTRETLVGPLLGISGRTGAAGPDVVGVASVVPWASDELITVLLEIFPTAMFLVIMSGNMPLVIDYPKPEELGTDRLLGALAAYTHWGEPEHRPCIVIDFGTATTYDCITGEGVYLGGAIAPGIELGAEALAQRAAQLPSIELAFPSSIIGRTTVESIQSGVLYGAVAQMEGMVERLRHIRFEGQEPIVVATGGLSRIIQGHTSVLTHCVPSLVLDGIRIAAERAARERWAEYHSEQAAGEQHISGQHISGQAAPEPAIPERTGPGPGRHYEVSEVPHP